VIAVFVKMGGHGGLNILPQKSWNVYNYDNREKVRRDEEAAAREEQLKQEQARRRDAEFRLEILRQAKRKSPPPRFESAPDVSRPTLNADDAVISLPEESNHPQTLDRDSNHINLFDGWDGFQMDGNAGEEFGRKDSGKKRKDDGQKDSGKNQKDYGRKDSEKNRKDDGRPEKKRRKGETESVRVPLPEDEKYRLGYGVAGKDVKKPWYLSKNWMDEEEVPLPAQERRSDLRDSSGKTGEKSQKKKSLQELREERLKREQQERERARKLLFSSADDSRGKTEAFRQSRAPYYNSGYGNRR